MYNENVHNFCEIAPSTIIIQMIIYKNNLVYANIKFFNKTFSEIKAN